MRKIVWSFFAIALILSAASCQDNGLDANYSNSTLTITATIVEPETSRMGYTFPDNNIQPTWADGDQVFGFDSEGNNFTFEVESVTDGRATMTVVGEYTPVNGRTIYAMFVPGKRVTDIEGNEVVIELDKQTNVNNPSVILCATSTVSENTVNLGFRYQTAIVGVKQFKIPETSADVTSLKLVGAKAQGTIKVEGGELKLVPADGTQTITASPATSWTANESGIVSTPVYFMVIPTVDAELELQATTATANYVNLSHIGEDGLDIEAGHYYYMSKNLATPVAQVGREKYTTIDAAWAAANAATSDVTVTLLANCTATSTLTLDNSGTNAVTLDLNGHNLTGSSSVTTITALRELVITDSKGTGKITSPYYYVVRVEGSSTNVTISNCTIVSTNTNTSRTTYVYPAAVLIYDENTQSGKTESHLTINNATIYTENKLTAVSNRNGNLEITNSEISSGITTTGMVGVSTGDNSNTEVTPSTIINSGCFYCSNTEGTRPAAYLYGTGSRVTINDGFFYSEGTRSVRAATAATLANYTINGGFYNKEIPYEYQSKMYYPSYKSGYSCQQITPSSTTTHSKKGTLSFGYQVKSE
ncbi:MAG: hypothetical protein IKR82_01030 [Bacteroidales bacterium]|nr:hypothetical protein [Bacteroidales bacterium]